MLSETLVAGLEQYRIGPKIRALRLAKDLGQVQLAQHTGLSPALLSKIERGNCSRRSRPCFASRWSSASASSTSSSKAVNVRRLQSRGSRTGCAYRIDRV